jgi:hypothetical protein
MKKNKFFLAATVVLLAVGTVFGASKMHHKKDNVTVYYLTGSPAVCTAIQCSVLTTGTPYCVASNTQFYTTIACTTPITPNGVGLSKPY